jgi:oxygen-independent coproporphyrinogen-3 oxidase
VTGQTTKGFWKPEQSNEQELGLYLHIPFCSQLCHYCDFAKTANFDHPRAERYFAALLEHLKIWIGAWESSRAKRPTFSSFFWGGGTPGLFDDVMAPIFAYVAPYLAADAEVSLEANPGNVTARSLRIWRDLGFNRISLGVQTFASSGLNFLKRDHSAEQAKAAVHLAREQFENINVDLIYGWQRQSLEIWRQDLLEVLKLKTAHLSLYNLIYEAGTPIGRAMHRGILQPVNEELDLSCYQLACDILGADGFIHDEVSNWARPGRSSRHNWLYWQARHYLGIGSGAHGYLPGNSPIGTRYAYHGSERQFMNTSLALTVGSSGSIDVSPGLKEDPRDQNSWLLEYIGCSLRSRIGVDCRRIAVMTGKEFYPTWQFLEAQENRTMTLDAMGTIRLIPAEWFREVAWSLVLSECFV